MYKILSNGEIEQITEKVNVIIDTDPGVDDCAAIALSLYDDMMDIKLITTVCGNLDLETVTRNLMHVLELFKRTDIPVVKGASRAMYRISPDASFIHQEEGMGGYHPPKTVKTKPIDTDAVEAMYETIKKYKNNIYIIALGPQTNVGTLIQRHPDVAKMVNGIYTEGCAPFGWTDQGKWKDYISFNASSDPEALKIVINSGIPVTYIPSRMGREITNFNEEEVYKLAEINDVGKFLSKMYNGYWEHGYQDKRVATNDTCAVLALRFPGLFRKRKVNFEVDVTGHPGRTYIYPTKWSKIEFIYTANKEKLHEFFFNAVKKLDFIKIDKRHLTRGSSKNGK